MKRKLKLKYKKLIINIFICIFFIIFGISIYQIGKKKYYEKKSEEVEQIIYNQVIQIDETNGELEEKINFSKLKELNPDIIGWIEIPKTNINYAIVKGINNTFYLNHDVLKNYNIYGSIFMNYQNKSDFTDNNTILFGHNTYKDTIFGELIKLQEGKLGNDIKIIIHTEFEKQEYHVYAAYITEESDENPLNKQEKYFQKNDSPFVMNQIPKKTLTLSTCYYDKTKRVIIHAGIFDEL